MWCVCVGMQCLTPGSDSSSFPTVTLKKYTKAETLEAEPSPKFSQALQVLQAKLTELPGLSFNFPKPHFILWESIALS